MLIGCGSAPRNEAAIRAYYQYDFTTAREALRPDATRNDAQVVLNNLRLGLAALADGDTVEAELALGRAFELLSTAGLNKDRTTAAIFVHEGVKIWKGEPFEQALAYTWVATLYATLGDWENVRAAAANALFRLTDFGADQDPGSLTRRAASDPDYLEEGYTAVDTDFALGFILEAIGSDLSGAPGAAGQLEAAVRIDPGLAPLAETLRERRYDTLFIVDYGKGPTKIAYGPDEVFAKFVPQEYHRGPLVVRVDGTEVARTDPVCNVDAMSFDHRWNNLEDVRRAKSVLGNVLVTGGAFTMSAAGRGNAGGAALIGLGMMLIGALAKAGARADTRYLEFAPQSVYIVAVSLEEPSEVELVIAGDTGSRFFLPEVVPGRRGDPRAIYLRLHGLGSPDPDWLAADTPVYHDGSPLTSTGDLPWILGGNDVSIPDDAALAAYRLEDALDGLTARDLENLYWLEDIRIGPGRHILEGGSALYRPAQDSMGYKRLMYSQHPAYRPKSQPVRELAGRIADARPVHQEEPQ